ncbi:MAG: cytochrome c [Anaerolineae bacterium]|uniref:c-type cytochrome n=1 Tax=Promineifilum sp. TaxID=2664178 RepID=UPI001D25CE4B|nr:cytochrome c [Anaerolineales bacterium]MCB8935531.1 cytochrome c [Promineifilum sp.]MCO5181312.1 cytochrome c [Promineifilum sp.]MCW5847291.1 cytochrome c [Anaerolineae bacterium]
MTRTASLGATLLVVAGLLLALSFAPWASQEPAVDPTVVRPSPTSDPAAVGRTLFSIKGCATCHRHDGLPAERVTQGGQVVAASRSLTGASGAPDLTDYDPDPGFVRVWLRDPEAVRPGTRMPNLGLSEEEIAALLAFLEE